MTLLGDKAVGDTIYINVGGVSYEFIIVHQGTPSADYAGDCDGTWLLMKDIYEERKLDESRTSPKQYYNNKDIHTYLNSTFLDLFDSNIKPFVRTIKIPYTYNRYASAAATGENGLSTQVFLLSYQEVGFTNDSHADAETGAQVEGVALDYFVGTDAAADTKRSANFNGVATRYTLRTPYIWDETIYYMNWAVFPDGTARLNNSTTAYGIRPALVIDPSLIVRADGGLKSSLKGYSNIGGTWRETATGYANIGGTWRELTEAYKNIGGVWKE